MFLGTLVISSKFRHHVIYENELMELKVVYIKKEEGKFMGALKFRSKILATVNFLNKYFRINGEKISKDDFSYSYVGLNILDIKKEIKKRLEILEQWDKFRGYCFQYVQPPKNEYLYKQIEIKKSKNFYPEYRDSLNDREAKPVLKEIYAYLRERLKQEGKNFVEITGFFELELDGENICIDVLDGELSIGFKYSSFQKTEFLISKIYDYIEELDNILNKKNKVSKIAEKSKYKLYSMLTLNKLDHNFISYRFHILLLQYKRLNRNGEILYSQKFIDLLEDMLLVLNGYTPPSGINPPLTYIIENYNKIIEWILENKDSGFAKYYSKRLDSLIRINPDSKEIIVIIKKLNKLNEISCGMNIDFEKLAYYMTHKHISLFIKYIDIENKYFLNSLYSGLLKYDLSQNIDEVDFRKYKDILNIKLSDYLRIDFENLKARCLVV